MRTSSLAIVTLAVFSVSACQETNSTMDQSLSEDLALAASSGGLDLTPGTESRSTVSALEQVQRQTTARPAPSQRAITYRPASRVVTQVPVEAAIEVPAETPVTEPEAVIPAAPEVVSVQAPSPEPQVTEQSVVDATPAPMPSARPQPVAVNPPERSNVGTTARGPIGVVIRGGTVDGDHCDPRVDRRRRGGSHVAINNRIPRRF